MKMASPREIEILTGYCKGKGINIGCGSRPIEGAINVDTDPEAKADVYADASRLPFCSNRFDYVVSSHCLEHVQEAPLLIIREWLRPLKIGGTLAFLVPDGSQGTIALGPNAGVFIEGKHVHIFTEETLRYLLEFAGAKVIKIETLERLEWKTRTILVVAKKTYASEEKEIDAGSITAYLIWLQGLQKTLTPKGLFKWFRKKW